MKTTSDYRRPASNSWTLHPDGFVVRGVNMTPHPSDAGSWKSMWVTWNWSGWLQPQIDAAVRAGANTVRLFGTHQGILDGSVSNAQMTSRWQQWADYATGRGLALYPCLGDDFNQGTYTANDVASSSAAQATVLNAYASRCIGMDNLQEMVAYQQSPTNLGIITPAVRAVTSIPLAYSVSGAVGYPGASYADFGDFHSYSKSVTRSALDAFWGTNPTVKVLSGEFGIPYGSSYADESDYYAYALDLVANYVGPAGQRLAGACAWAISNQATTSAGWGLYDTNFTNEQTGMTDVWRLFPTTRWT